MLSRELLEAGVRRRYLELPLPSGETARIRNLSEEEAARAQRPLMSAEGRPSPEVLEEYHLRLVAECLVDCQGAALLEPAEFEILSRYDAADLLVLVDAARKHCGFVSGGGAGGGGVESAKKNSGPTPDSSSATASPRDWGSPTSGS